MKKLILIVVIISVIISTVYAQQTGVRFGIEANQFVIQSGFGTSTELKIFVQDPNGKRLSLGLYYDSKFERIGGISTSFLQMLRNHNKTNNPILDPYMFYNFIYRKTTITETLNSENYRIAAGTYKSMEHYIGFGLRTNITKRFYTTGEFGYGLYLGSIMKPSTPDPALNESFGTNGTGLITKIGIGYLF
jgi:hypothetical protein